MAAFLVLVILFAIFCIAMAVRSMGRQKGQTTGPMSNEIHETKLTCQACGNVWHYSSKDVLKEVGNALMDFNSVKVFGQKTQDAPWSKCPKCGSRAIKQEKVTYQV